MTGDYDYPHGGAFPIYECALPTWDAKMTEKYDPIVRPAHYTQAKIESIDVIEAWAPTWPSAIAPHMSNVVKYTCRFPTKGTPIEDLKKLVWYAQRAVEVLERAPPLKSWRELAGTGTPREPDPIACAGPGPVPSVEEVEYREGSDLAPAVKDGDPVSLDVGDYVEVTEGPGELPPGSSASFHRKGTRGWVCQPKEGGKPFVLVRTSVDPGSELYAVAVKPVAGAHGSRSQ